MTYLNKTATLAAGLVAALLLSTSLASAADAGRREPARINHAQNAHADHTGTKHPQASADRDRRATDRGYDHTRYADRFHRPPARDEAHGKPAHAGLRWHAGHWHWHNAQWVWSAGTWRIAAHTHG